MVVNHRGFGFLTRPSTYQACDLGQVTQLGKASVAVRLKKDNLFGTMPGAQQLSRERQTDCENTALPRSLGFWMEREMIPGPGVLPCRALGTELAYTPLGALTYSTHLFFSAPFFLLLLITIVDLETVSTFSSLLSCPKS